MSSCLWPQVLQHARLPCPSPSPWACSNSCPLHWFLLLTTVIWSLKGVGGWFFLQGWFFSSCHSKIPCLWSPLFYCPSSVCSWKTSRGGIMVTRLVLGTRSESVFCLCPQFVVQKLSTMTPFEGKKAGKMCLSCVFRKKREQVSIYNCVCLSDHEKNPYLINSFGIYIFLLASKFFGAR